MIAERIHLFPSRTQKLSSLAQTIPGGRLPGKIWSCRFEKRTDSYIGSFIFLIMMLFQSSRILQIMTALFIQFHPHTGFVGSKALQRTADHRRWDMVQLSGKRDFRLQDAGRNFATERVNKVKADYISGEQIRFSRGNMTARVCLIEKNGWSSQIQCRIVAMRLKRNCDHDAA